MSDSYNLKFLESAENLKLLVHARTGRTLSTTIAREITTCLHQGRLFYEAAASSPLEIRPLQLFYGMMAFAKGLVTALEVRSIATLPKSHGISDCSSEACRIADLRVKINREGTYQQFNDVVAKINRFCFFDDSTTPRALRLPSAKSEKLVELELSLKELLGRIPGLQSLYRNTFKQEAKVDRISAIDQDSRKSGLWKLRVDDRELFHDVVSLRLILERWRERHIFLKKWCLVSAQKAWGYSVIEFGNLTPEGIDEFRQEFFDKDDGRYQLGLGYLFSRQNFPLDQGLPPLAGGYSGDVHAIIPFGDVYPSEFSLQYLALFLLSSLVRYRPQTWMHAISRTASESFPADDQSLALIELFLELNNASVPSLVVQAINPHEDKYEPIQQLSTDLISGGT